VRDVRRRRDQGDGTPEPDGAAGVADPEPEAEVAHGVQGRGGVRHGRGRYDAAGEPEAVVGNMENIIMRWRIWVDILYRLGLSRVWNRGVVVCLVVDLGAIEIESSH